jgi:stage II sporulation protein D
MYIRGFAFYRRRDSGTPARRPMHPPRRRIIPSRRGVLFMAAAGLSAWLVGDGCEHENPPAPPPAGTPTVRVLLLEDVPQANFSATDAPTVRVGSVAQRVDLSAGGSAGLPITFAADGWRIGDTRIAGGGGAAELIIEPATLGSVRVDGLPHRGRYRCVPTSPGRFDVINDLDMESYLQGVLAKEMLAGWHPEAYRAQAIAARTYALYESLTGPAGPPSRAWDVYTDQRSQVYGGIAGESAKSREAVEYTRGIVLTWGEPGHRKIFKAYFSACCGGISQSAADAFGDPPIPPLGEQYRGDCCSASPKFNWGPIVMSRDDLTRRVRAWGVWAGRPEANLAKLASLDISYVNRFGRPVRFQITDARGSRYSLGSEDLRHACNADPHGGPTLPSSFFHPMADPGSDTIRFETGHGSGHGVGMCQWCAEMQARAGQGCQQIVLSAYPQGVLIRAY